MLSLTVFGILLVVTAAIHEGGYRLRPKSRGSLILRTLGWVVIVCMALQFYNVQRGAVESRLAVTRLQYSDVSKLSALGLLRIAGSPNLVEQSRINTLIAPFVKLEPKFHLDCSPEAMAAFDSVVALDDKFPFVYWYRGLCLRATDREGWKQDFAKAKAILEITTNITGHNQNHDEVLKDIEIDATTKWLVNHEAKRVQ
jgi:hypothetical protein